MKKTNNTIHMRLRAIPGIAWLDDYTDTPLGFYAGLAVAMVLWAGVVLVVAPAWVLSWPGEATTNHPPHGAELQPNTSNLNP